MTRHGPGMKQCGQCVLGLRPYSAFSPRRGGLINHCTASSTVKRSLASSRGGAADQGEKYLAGVEEVPLFLAAKAVLTRSSREQCPLCPSPGRRKRC